MPFHGTSNVIVSKGFHILFEFKELRKVNSVVVFLGALGEYWLTSYSGFTVKI